MNTSYEDLTKLESAKEDPKLWKATNKSAMISTFVTTTISLFVFFAIITSLESKFEKIVVCLLALIFFHLKSEAVFHDLEKHGKDISGTSGAVVLFFKAILGVVATITLLYIVFLTN